MRPESGNEGKMKTHMQREIDNLKRQLLSLGADIEERINDTYNALTNMDVAIAVKVKNNDDYIDQREVEIEEECLKILALYQPVASDLRIVIGMLKMNNDLERIGDLAANIAEYVMIVARDEPVTIPAKFNDIFSEARKMVRHCLDALVNLDPILADKVCSNDDIVDRLNVEIIDEIRDQMQSAPQKIRPLLYLISISRSIERIADNATNIAEDVVYMTQGEIVRHHLKDHGQG